MRVAPPGPAPGRGPGPLTGLAHGAALVSSDAQLLATALPFVEAGLRAGDVVVLACPDAAAALVVDALGEQASRVELEPGIGLIGSRPPDALATCRRYLERAQAGGSGRVRILADIDFGADPADWREGQRFESVVNRLLAGAPVDVVCVYDQRRLPQPVLHSAAATHPLVVRGAGWSANPGYRSPEDYVPALPVPHEPIEDSPPVFEMVDAPGLAVLRRGLGGALDALVSDERQREDLHLATAEIAANAFRHGTRPVSARVWCGGGRIVCAVTDSGTTYSNPFSGFTPAHGDDLSRGGMGLWLARKLWDHVDVLPRPHGLTVRLSSRLA